MKLEWQHKENNKESFIQTEVKIKKSVNRDYGYGGKLICNKCNGKLSQKYKCDTCKEQITEENCKLLKNIYDELLSILYFDDIHDEVKEIIVKEYNDEIDEQLYNLSHIDVGEYTIGEIEKREDKLSGIIYNEEQKKQFMEYNIDTNMKVIDEIPLSDVMENIEFIEDFYEIYNNDETELIKKIHNFLHKKQIVLVVEYGYLGKEKAGFIYSTGNKLLLIRLRDNKLIKEPKQMELNTRVNGYTEKLSALTESREPQLYKEFLMKIQNGEKIEKPTEKKEEQPKKVEVDFLNGF